jgi:ribosomal protein S18 acetylase RimI-like enzyme
VPVRERRAGDGRAVRRVARAAWRATYEGRIPSDFVRAVLRRGYDRRRLVESLADRRRDAFVADDGEVVGYADLFAPRRGDAELTRLYVRPDRQGRGIGRALLGAAVAAARRRRARAVEVGVDPTNERAIAWYLRQGFREKKGSTLEVGTLSRPIRTFSLAL